MRTFPTQTLDTTHLSAWDTEREQKDLHLQAQESRWWFLEPGEEGYGVPLHEYLGFTESAWREYAISPERNRW